MITFPYHAFIFDFDGVIIDTETKRFNDYNMLLDEKGYPLLTDFKAFIGRRIKTVLQEHLPHTPESSIIDIIAQQKEYLSEDEALIPGIKPLLEYLMLHNTTMAIATGNNHKRITSILEKNNLENYFDVIISENDFTASKPHPECYQVTLQKLKVASHQAVIIEDSPAGIIAGRRAGCEVYALQTYFSEQELPSATAYFRNHDDLLHNLKKKDQSTSLFVSK